MEHARFCPYCRKQTMHITFRDEEGAERIFFGILTLGASECLNRRWAECCECGNAREIKK